MGHLLLLLGLAAPLTLPIPLQDDAAEASSEVDTESEADGSLTLEELFPEKSIFGPGARSISISPDGRFGAYLWRPWIERRHGNDLWVHDFETGEAHRLTSADAFEAFQKDARKVVRDREEHGAKNKDGDGDGGEDEDESGEEEGSSGGPAVSEDDADREDAPRWRGVMDYAWSPEGSDLLIVCGGDLYSLSLPDGELERLTHTRNWESSVQWLPEGGGYLYRDDDSIFRVTFGDHRAMQLDPELPSGEEISSFSISPDGKKLAIRASKGARGFSSGGRTVKIADYGSRFMEVREVPRLVSDDPQPDRKSILYVYELPDGMDENGVLHHLHTHEHTGPRDTVGSPDWAPDSSRVTFAVFTQSDSEVDIYQAILPDEEEGRGTWADLVAKARGEEASGEEGEQDDQDEDETSEEVEDESPEDGEDPLELPARTVYRFLHHGGPNTPRMVSPRYAADSRHILFINELSGFRHLGRLDPLYERFEALTSGPFEVYMEGLSKDRRHATLTATREGPECLDVYRLDLEDGELQRLSQSSGRYGSPAVSEDGKHMLATFSAYGRLPELVHGDLEAGSESDLTSSHSEKASELTKASPEFFDFEGRHGFRLHGMMFKPDGWTAEDRRPCLIYVYGGPLGTRKTVVQGSFSGAPYFFAWYMAKVHGYVTVSVDTRGMSGYGAVFEKANFEQVGKPQVEDLVDTARWLVENAGVDPEKIGLHGWSFGGFQTQMCMYTEPEVFACGIAGAGPTEWENYNSWYSTGTIGDSREGTPDLEKYSLLPLAKNLQRKLLLVHGMEDSNVLYQDTVRVYAELLDAGKETLVELFLDPSGGHGLGGQVKSLNRYRKYEEFLLRCLGAAEE